MTTHDGNDQVGSLTTHKGLLRDCPAPECQDRVVEQTHESTEPPMTAVAPNPHSPYADADPRYRHIFATITFSGDPAPGGLVPTACERLAVVPGEPLQDANTGNGSLPEGLCPVCVDVMQGGEPPAQQVSNCRECEGFTDHDGLCAVCRQELHDEWWPTRDQVQPTA